MPDSFCAEALARGLASILTDSDRILIARSRGGSPVLTSILEKAGLVYDDIVLYQVEGRLVSEQRDVYKRQTEELCRACLEHAQGDICALFILDLDDFKHINDERGHQAGDVVLRAFGDTIHKCVRQDDVAGRIGGDEFMLFMGCLLYTSRCV